MAMSYFWRSGVRQDAWMRLEDAIEILDGIPIGLKTPFTPPHTPSTF